MTPSTSGGFRAPRARHGRIALIAALVVLSGCASLRRAMSRPPEGQPSGRPGWLVYTVGDLRFETPETWKESGSADRVTLTSPADDARLVVARGEDTYADEKACLAGAEEKLAADEARFERVRRHQTTFANRPAIVQEADQSGWHGWGYAVCDGKVQYRIFFVGRSPIPKEIIEVYRELVGRARIGGEA